MNGNIIPGTSIAVDFWQAQKTPGIRLFFLTHLHGDHIVGLTSSWRWPIHCSPLTARLLVERYGISPSLLHPLEEDQTHLIGYCPSDCVQNHIQTVGGDNGQTRKRTYCTSISVTVINANHCPGAVMFLFEGPFGKILHTGDFRFCSEMLKDGSLLSRHKGTIDCLYLDNTYCSTKCCFPTREEALQKIVEIVKIHPDHDIVFGLRNLGKEELLANVARNLQEWINVSPRLLSVVSSLGFPDFFKTGRPDIRIRVELFQKISSEFVRELNSKKPTIVILPTALYQGICGKPYANQPQVFIVPYSDHSSFPELVKFVAGLKPACVVPIVQGKSRGPFGVDISDRQDMSCFQPYLSKDRALRKQNSSLVHKHLSQTGANQDGEGFEYLFPDFQDSHQVPPLKKIKSKRSQFMKTRRKKKFHLMGVHYLTDDEEEDNTESADPARSVKEKNANQDHRTDHVARHAISVPLQEMYDDGSCSVQLERPCTQNCNIMNMVHVHEADSVEIVHENRNDADVQGICDHKIMKKISDDQSIDKQQQRQLPEHELSGTNDTVHHNVGCLLEGIPSCKSAAHDETVCLENASSTNTTVVGHKKSVNVPVTETPIMTVFGLNASTYFWSAYRPLTTDQRRERILQMYNVLMPSDKI